MMNNIFIMYQIFNGEWRYKYLDMTTPEQTEKRIDNLTDRVGCSEKGNAWLKQALDPFSDVEYEVDGFPDLVCGNSVVQRLKLETTISRPSTVPATDPWDCCIYLSAAEIDTQVMTTSNLVNQVYHSTGQAAAHKSGGLCVRSGPAGGDLHESRFVKNLAPNFQYFDRGTSRVISKGFEIHDTTAQIYQQGALITWRMPSQAEVDVAGVNFQDGAAVTPVSRTASQSLPANAAEAITLPGSKEWSAKEGCYITAVLGEPVNEPLRLGNQAIITIQDPLLVNQAWVTPISGVLGSSYIASTEKVMKTNFNQCGAFLTGLNPLSTLTVIYHVFIERFPNLSNLDLIVLANPSPSYDPAALELYSKVATHLPTGTMVKNNDMGKWIKQVADTLQEFGVPGMPLVKGAVSIVQAFGMKGGKGKTNKMNEIKNLEKRLMNTEKRIERKIDYSTRPLPQIPRQRIPTFKQAMTRNPYAVKQKKKNHTPKKKKPFKYKGKGEYNV